MIHYVEINYFKLTFDPVPASAVIDVLFAVDSDELNWPKFLPVCF